MKIDDDTMSLCMHGLYKASFSDGSERFSELRTYLHLVERRFSLLSLQPGKRVSKSTGWVVDNYDPAVDDIMTQKYQLSCHSKAEDKDSNVCDFLRIKEVQFTSRQVWWALLGRESQLKSQAGISMDSFSGETIK